MTALEYTENRTSELETKLISNPTETTTPPMSPNSLHNYKQDKTELIAVGERDDDESLLETFIQTPPQSAGSLLNRSCTKQTIHIEANSNKQKHLTNYLKLSESFKLNHSNFRKNLSLCLNRLQKIEKLYFIENKEYLDKFDLNYECEKQRDLNSCLTESEDEAEDEEDEHDYDYDEYSNEYKSEQFWNERRLRLGSEWTRVQCKLNLIKSKSNLLNTKAKTTSNLIINKANLIENFEPARTYFKKEMFKEQLCKCACSNLNNNRKNRKNCIYCFRFRATENKSNKEKKKNKCAKQITTTKNNENQNLVLFYHSYSKKPLNTNQLTNSLVNENSLINDQDFNLIDDDLLNKLVNERLNNLFNTPSPSTLASNSDSIQYNNNNNSNNKNILKNQKFEEATFELPDLNCEELLFLCDGLPQEQNCNEDESYIINNSNNNNNNNNNNNRQSDLLLNTNKINHTNLNKINSKRSSLDLNPIENKRRKIFKLYDETKFKNLRINSRLNSLITNTNSIDSNNENLNPKQAGSRSTRRSSSSASSKSNYSSTSTSEPSKYDINNIILIDSYKQIEIVATKQSNITIPKYRESTLEPLSNITDEQLNENLNDDAFSKRHKKVEIDSNLNLSINKNLFTDILIETSLNNDTNTGSIEPEWPKRVFPLNDQDYEQINSIDESNGLI